MTQEQTKKATRKKKRTKASKPVTGEPEVQVNGHKEITDRLERVETDMLDAVSTIVTEYSELKEKVRALEAKRQQPVTNGSSPIGIGRVLLITFLASMVTYPIGAVVVMMAMGFIK